MTEQCAIDAEHLRDRLAQALREAIDAIQLFHGPGWELYRDHSPEMKRWRALLAECPTGPDPRA